MRRISRLRDAQKHWIHAALPCKHSISMGQCLSLLEPTQNAGSLIHLCIYISILLYIQWFTCLCVACACSPLTHQLALFLFAKWESPAARHDCPGRTYPVESLQQPPPCSVRLVEWHPGLRAGSSISVLRQDHSETASLATPGKPDGEGKIAGCQRYPGLCSPRGQPGSPLCFPRPRIRERSHNHTKLGRCRCTHIPKVNKDTFSSSHVQLIALS